MFENEVIKLKEKSQNKWKNSQTTNNGYRKSVPQCLLINFCRCYVYLPFKSLTINTLSEMHEWKSETKILHRRREQSKVKRKKNRNRVMQEDEANALYTYTGLCLILVLYLTRVFFHSNFLLYLLFIIIPLWN